MGCSVSLKLDNAPIVVMEGARNAEINRQLKRDLTERLHIIKMILLGAAECGKSTILKQIRIIHTEGFTDEELMAKRTHIIANAFECMAIILIAMRDMNIIVTSGDPKFRDDAAMIEQIVNLCQQTLDGVMDKSAAEALKRLWANEKVLETYDRRSEYHLPDCAKYFLDDIDRISAPNYTPTLADILHCRIQTMGITEISFNYHSDRFSVIDVGGQRTERRKWIHLFDDCKAVIFVAALSEYDQVCSEDNCTNRMQESLLLFENICRNPFFTNSAMILFLNKCDLFEEKVRRVPLTVCFSHYTGSQAYNSCYEYIEGQFVAKNIDDAKRVYAHATCATDTNQVQLILHSCIDMIQELNFKLCAIN